MIPLLVGGSLILLVGTLMLLVAAFITSQVWGVLCFVVPPLQWLFAAFNWEKAWDGLMMQLLGLAMVLAFFVRADQGFSLASVDEAWTQFKREQGLLPAMVAADGTVLVDGQPVQAVSAQTTADGDVVQTVEGDAPVATVVGKASEAVDDKPINKCTDADGNETYSRGPCPAFKVPAKK
jgi:hypothetical protein